MCAWLHVKLDAFGHREAALGGAIEVVDAALPSLPYLDGTFDTIVLSLVLCSVADADVAPAGAEVRRVLAPARRVLVIEHLPAADATAARRQARWAAPWRLLFNGCQLRLESVAALAAGGFGVGRVVDRSWHMSPFEDLCLPCAGGRWYCGGARRWQGGDGAGKKGGGGCVTLVGQDGWAGTCWGRQRAWMRSDRHAGMSFVWGCVCLNSCSLSPLL